MVTSTAVRSRQRDTKKIRKEARDLWTANKALGWRMTGLELGDHFGFTDSWGRGVIREIENPEPETSPEPSEPDQYEPHPASTEPSVSLPPIVTPQEVSPTPQMVEAPTAVQSEPDRDTAEAPQVDDEKRRWMFFRRPQRAPRVTAPKPAREPRVPNPQRRGASGVSWLAFGLGIVISVSANVGHIWFVSKPSAEAMVSAMVLAAFWPVALAVAVEVLSRVTWPAAFRWPGLVGTVLVGGVALVVSYRHMNGLLLYFGESDLSAMLGPIGVDGLLIVGGFALLAIGETKKRVR